MKASCFYYVLSGQGLVIFGLSISNSLHILNIYLKDSTEYYTIYLVYNIICICVDYIESIEESDFGVCELWKRKYFVQSCGRLGKAAGF